MAITVTFKRVHHTFTQATTEEFITATLAGTYATGGFQFNPLAIEGSPGSSSFGAANSVLTVDFYGQNGFNYLSTASGNTVTTKIFSASGTELANGTAVPDLTMTCVIVKKK